MALICKHCLTEKDESQFYAQSKQRCKKCTNANNKARYHRTYAVEKKAARRAIEHDMKAVRILHPVAERAYMAAIVDGEGSIQLRRRGEAGGTTFRTGQFTLVVQVVNTAKPLIDWLVQYWGGAIGYSPEDPAHNRKGRWTWTVAANNALAVLDEIMEFLVIKRRQCILGRRFQRYTQGKGRPQTEKVRALHTRFFEEFRRLNLRGLAGHGSAVT